MDCLRDLPRAGDALAKGESGGQSERCGLSMDSLMIEPLDLYCVTCKARPGDLCRMLWGLLTRPASHLSRVRIAERANRMQRTGERPRQWRPS